MAGCRSGYEYRYRVWMNSKVKKAWFLRLVPKRTYLLEVRTNFILKPASSAEESIVDTERFGARLPVDEFATPETYGELGFKICSGKNFVDFHIRHRLSEYCMPDDQIRAVAQTAFDFAHRLADDLKYNSFHMIPIVVGIDVCTVQMEGEPLDDTIRRSVKPDFLIPLKLWTISNFLFEGPEVADYSFRCYLRSLPVVRVRGANDDEGFEACPICLRDINVRVKIGSLASKHAMHRDHSVGCEEGLALMEVCPICLCRPIVGDQIASLSCKHAFHKHCVVRWLLKKRSCPLCRMEIVI